LAWNIAEGRLYAVRGSRAITLEFDALVLCTGATDRLMPVKGWNLAGTYSLGGAQVALKAQACAIGKQVVFVGTGALLYLVAAQYLKAGAGVAAVLDTSPWSRRIAALPNLLAIPSALWKGIALTRALRRGGVPVHTGIEPLEIEGTAEAGGFLFKDARGRSQRIACDAVALGYHLRPETQLADLARCEFFFDAATRQWLPLVDGDGRSSVRGIYLAGDGKRVLGANAAEQSGRLVALAVLQDLGRAPSPEAVARLRGELANLNRFAQGLSEAFPWPAQQAARLADDTIVCRCESVSVGELRRVVQQAGALESNRAKAFSRVGMGRCQGRYCGHAAAEIIAQTANVPLEQVGRLRGAAPVKPLPISVEAGATEESV
jgi:NADPH-dependent 2,4-dienoyl-CoA reductase/sulfur reductase-like enzyme